MKYEKIPDLNLGLAVEDLHLDDVLYNPYFYEQELVKVIVSPTECITAFSVAAMAEHVDRTVKIEGMEKLSVTLHRCCKQLAALRNHDGPITCHLFLARNLSDSFPEHTDPDDVIVYVVEGEKTMLVEGEEIVLHAGEALYMRHGTRHQALNHKASIMLSFGLERYLLEKI